MVTSTESLSLPLFLSQVEVTSHLPWCHHLESCDVDRFSSILSVFSLCISAPFQILTWRSNCWTARESELAKRRRPRSKWETWTPITMSHLSSLLNRNNWGYFQISVLVQYTYIKKPYFELIWDRSNKQRLYICSLMVSLYQLFLPFLWHLSLFNFSAY